MKTLNQTLTILTLAAALLTASPAQAASTSWLTLGGGPTVGLAHMLPVTGGSTNAVISEMNVRLKMLKVLGFDFNYNMTGEKQVGHGEVYASNLRASALLYVVPTSILSVYLSAGAGATNIGNLTSSSATNKSYHGGAGMEIYVGKHLALSTEFLMLVPQVSKLVVSQQPLRIDEMGSLDTGSIAGGPAVSDYINPKNFQLTFGMKYFF
jgi:hypothetical protein